MTNIKIKLSDRKKIDIWKERIQGLLSSPRVDVLSQDEIEKRYQGCPIGLIKTAIQELITAGIIVKIP